MPDSKDATRWIEYAENDFQAAVQIKTQIASSAAFLFHAATEKYLKAALLTQQKPVPHTHDISVLIYTIDDQLAAHAREQQAAKLLDVIFNISRYPDDLLELGLPETQSVYEAALVLREFARAKLGLSEQ
jgi:HEPN domain-containing protein